MKITFNYEFNNTESTEDQFDDIIGLIDFYTIQEEGLKMFAEDAKKQYVLEVIAEGDFANYEVRFISDNKSEIKEAIITNMSDKSYNFINKTGI